MVVLVAPKIANVTMAIRAQPMNVLTANANIEWIRRRPARFVVVLPTISAAISKSFALVKSVVIIV